jgi:hypothetical protein
MQIIYIVELADSRVGQLIISAIVAAVLQEVDVIIAVLIHSQRVSSAV